MMRVDAKALVDSYGRSAAAGEKPEYLRLHRDRYVALLAALAAVPPGRRPGILPRRAAHRAHRLPLRLRAGR